MRKPEYIYRKQTPDLFIEMIVALLSTLHGQELDAIQAMRQAQNLWGIDEDWHLFASALDIMQIRRLAEWWAHGHDGHTIYRVF